MTDRIVKIRFIGDGITTVAGQVTALGKSVGAAADKMTSADREAQQFRRGLRDTGTTAGQVGLVAAAGLGAIVLATANFDQAMSNVQAATHESAAAMEDLRAAALKAGADTVFSASEAAGAVESLAKAGVSTADILAGGLDGALALAAAGGLEVADAADIAATALTQFRLAGEAVPHVADLLAAAAGKAQGDVSDMGMALKQSGLVASQMGISIEETTGTLAAFASAGLLGSDAGTSFRTMLLRLANPTADSAKLMKRLGIEAYDAQGNFVGMSAVAGQLTTAFQGKTQAERDSALATIFGSDAIRAASVLYTQGAEGVTDWTNKVNDSGFAAETAATRMNNLRGDLEQLKGSLETALIGAGGDSQGPLRSLVQGVTDAVNAFNSLPPVVRSAFTGLLAITALTGGALWFGSRVVGSIARTRVALAELGVTAGQTRAAMSGLSKGIELFAIIEGVNLLESSLQRLTHANLNTSSLTEELQHLGETGEATGGLAKTFGDDLDKFGNSAVDATDKIAGLTDKIAGWAPGDTSRAVANRQIRDLDAALSDLVSSGNADQAAEVFEMLAEAANDHGVSTKKLTSLFPAYRTQLSANSVAAKVMSDALTGLVVPTDGATAATGALGTAAQQSAEDIEAQAKALKEAREAAGDSAREFFNLGESVDDSRVSLNDWIKDLEKQSEALRDFTANATAAAKNGLKQGLIAELEAAGPAGALRMQQLANATDAEIERANRAWKRGQRAINDYVDTVGGIPPARIETAQAERNLRRLKRLIDSFHDIQVHVSILTGSTQAGANAAQFADLHGSADGSTVPKTGLAYADRHPYMLADGEEIISNRYGQADRWRPLLKAINSGMANGGTVGGRSPSAPVSLSLSDGDVDRIAGALLAARPVFGDVHLSGDGSFEREQRQRLSTLDGVRRP